MELEIAKVLTISTAHITSDDGRRLNESPDVDDVPHVLYTTEHFHMVWTLKSEVRHDAQEDGKPPLSPHFQALVKLAQDNDCEWLKLDTDGPVVDGLPSFRW